MTSKEYLSQIQKLDTMINNKLAEIEHWRGIASGVVLATEGERVQSSGSKEKMADAVCKCADIEKEVNSDIDALVNVRKEVLATIERLPMSEYDLIYKMYVGKTTPEGTVYMTLKEIAYANDKSYRWATAVHGTALSHLQQILDEREK